MTHCWLAPSGLDVQVEIIRFDAWMHGCMDAWMHAYICSLVCSFAAPVVVRVPNRRKESSFETHLIGEMGSGRSRTPYVRGIRTSVAPLRLRVWASARLLVCVSALLHVCTSWLLLILLFLLLLARDVTTAPKCHVCTSACACTSWFSCSETYAML